jgi:hypothetical protein
MSAATLDYYAIDRFFCNVMELIPSAQYFPTDPDDNFKQSMNKKYHKNVKAQEIASLEMESCDDVMAKPVAKRLKFNPKLQLTNAEQQLHEKEKEKTVMAQKTEDMDDEAMELTGLDGLRKRLAKRIEKMRAHRQSTKEHHKKQEHQQQTQQKRKSNHDDPKETLKKKRKQVANTSKHEDHHQKKGKHVKGITTTTTAKAMTKESTTIDSSSSSSSGTTSTTALSYGQLLLSQDTKDEKKKKTKTTRNGRSIHGIQNLLKKAEANKARMEELKKTEDGRQIVQAREWDKAMKQAAGDKVMDDPKLLRKKLKKKIQAKVKSSKEW